MPDDSSQASAASGGFLVNVNLVFLTTVAAYGISFCAAVLVARALGPDGRGLASLYQSAVVLGFGLMGLGTGTAALYFVARREMTARDAIEAGFAVTLAATVLSAIGVLITGALFGDQLAADGVPYWLAVIAIPAVIQFRVVEGVLRAQGRFGAMNVIELLQPLLFLIGLVAVDLASGLTVGRAITIWTLAWLPPVVLGYAMLGSDAWPRRLVRASILSKSVRFGVQGQLSNLIQLLNYRLDAYLVLAFVNTAGVGIYAVAVSLSEGMWFIANSVALVLQTKLTAADADTAAQMTPVVCRNTLLVTGLGSVCAAAVSPFVVPAVFGSDFDRAVAPFLWLLPGTVALAGAKVLSSYVFSRGRPLINAWIAFATLIVTLAVDLVLIPAFGVTGAAAGASLAYCFSLALTALAYRSLSGGSVADALVPRFADLAIYLDAARDLASRFASSRSNAGNSVSEERRGRS